MIDIVLDTNVLMAALLKRGGPNRRVLRIIIANPDIFRICYSSQMIAEYEDVLARPAITARGLQDEAAALLGLVKRIGCEVVPKPVYALVYPDLDDRPFLEAAVYVDGALITNNLRDFPFLGVTALGLEEFLGWVEDAEVVPL